MSADPITIRPIRTDEYERVRAVWEAAGLHTKPVGRDSEPEFARQLAHFPTTYLAAEQAGRIVGVVLGTHDQRKGWINRLAVIPEYRRGGVAQRLIAACEVALAAQGIDIVAALIESWNDASAALFRNTGYREDVAVHYFRKPRRDDV